MNEIMSFPGAKTFKTFGRSSLFFRPAVQNAIEKAEAADPIKLAISPVRMQWIVCNAQDVEHCGLKMVSTANTNSYKINFHLKYTFYWDFKRRQ